MADKPEWMMEIPVLTTAHLQQQTIGDLSKHWEDNPLAVVANYQEGMFLYLRREIEEVPVPDDLKKVRDWVIQQGYTWIRLDVDGVEIDGLPLYEW